MPTLEDAIALAAQAHAGQRDKAGQPYILHPLRVMLAQRDEATRMAAVLHDVVEDTAVTLGELQRRGYPDAVLQAVQALTKTPGEDRLAAAARAAANPIARQVKLADVADNMDLSRISHPGPEDHARLLVYARVREILLAGGA